MKDNPLLKNAELLAVGIYDNIYYCFAEVSKKAI